MNISDSIRTKHWSKLKFYDPAIILRNFREVEISIANVNMEERVRTLRTNILKLHRQGREAALLCHGIGTNVLNTTVYFSPTEESDYDFISLWVIDATLCSSTN